MWNIPQLLEYKIIAMYNVKSRSKIAVRHIIFKLY